MGLLREDRTVSLGSIPDEKLVVIKFWMVEGEEGNYWFTKGPSDRDSVIYWMIGKVLSHAKNGRSVKICGPSFGRWRWEPVDAEAIPIEGILEGYFPNFWQVKDVMLASDGGGGKGLCSSCMCMIPVGRVRIRGHLDPNGVKCPGSASIPLQVT